MTEIKTVTLAGSGIRTTCIGFGCSNLLGDKTPEQGLALLQAAYDAGVRHFDVARYYGFGDAEGLVGQLAQNRRDQITITTKFGLQPMKTVAGSRTLIDGVRKLMRSSTFIRNLVRRRVQNFVQHGRFDVNSARASVDASLRQLRTDYIDILLLHEADVEDCKPELLEFLMELKTKGTIRAFGVGSEFRRARAICHAAPQFTEVIQFDSTIFNDHVAQVPEEEPSLPAGSRARSTHGAMSAIDPLLDRLRDDPELARKTSAILGRDALDKSALGGVVLAAALRANPNGLVLFRSADRNRIAENIVAAFSPETAGQLSSLSALPVWPRPGAELGSQSRSTV